MHEPTQARSHPPFPLPALALLPLVLLVVSVALAGPSADEEEAAVPARSRIPLRGNETPEPDAEAPPALLPADLARAVATAPGAVAALYRALAEADPEAVPPYEESALNEVTAFLKKAGAALPPTQRLRAAEVVLGAALRFHLSVRDRPLDRPNISDLERRLRRQLFDVRGLLLHATAAAARREQGWADALALAERLRRTYPRAQSLLVESARVRTAYAGFRLLGGDAGAARRQVEWIEEHFLSDPAFQPLRVAWLYRPSLESVRRSLRDRAGTLLREAAALRDDRAALQKLMQALDAWPRLPGLRDAYLRRQNTYTVLHVGVRTLPEFLSPATAWTDPEKQAVELIFEGLLSASYEEDHGQRYLPQLSAGPPEAIPGGRRFHLDRAASWSSGERVTSADVRDTVQLLASPRLPGRTPEWTDLVEEPRLGNDPFRIDFTFRQSYFDPLAPLAFKVLPRTVKQADDEAFARKPVGSGPYQYVRRGLEDGRSCAVFAANPNYRRSGHPGRPAIREIRFCVSADPARDLRDEKQPLHLLLDLPTARLRQLEKAGVKDIRTLRNRRIYFLAVNHRVAALADQNLRRAFAHALDRDKILTYRFRGGEPAHRALAVTGGAAALATLDLRRDVRPEFHRPLNGPYPPRSWASPQAAAALYNLDQARTFARKARGKSATVELTLTYAVDEPGVAEACRDIADELARLGAGVGWGVQVRPVGLPPRQLREALLRRDYQLAYHHHDYATEGYWLWPLFDSRPEALQPGGANFLGYENDAALEGLFREAMSQRGFAEVKRLRHEIHAHLVERMPLIPLWQLDTHIAVHPALRPARLDPLLVFDRVADWQLGK